MARAVLRDPLPFPLTDVDVYRPVIIEASTKRSLTFDVLIVVDITSCQTPWRTTSAVVHGALLVLAHTVTALIAAAAFELAVRASEGRSPVPSSPTEPWQPSPQATTPTIKRLLNSCRLCPVMTVSSSDVSGDRSEQEAVDESNRLDRHRA